MNYIQCFLVSAVMISININSFAKEPITKAEALHEYACSNQIARSDNPWHITNLYNCSTNELYIPYQLWSGAQWNGDKQAPCMHPADRRSALNNSSNEIIVKGPIQWIEPETGEELEVWE